MPRLCRVDIDAELAKVDDDEGKRKKAGNVLRQANKPDVEETLSTTGNEIQIQNCLFDIICQVIEQHIMYN